LFKRKATAPVTESSTTVSAAVPLTYFNDKTNI